MPAQRTDEQIAELRKQLDKSVPDTSTEEQLYWHAMWRNRVLQYLPALLALAERPSNGGGPVEPKEGGGPHSPHRRPAAAADKSPPAPPTPDVEAGRAWLAPLQTLRGPSYGRTGIAVDALLKDHDRLLADLAAAKAEWNELNAINKTLEVERNAALASSEADRAALTRCLETQRMIEAANAKLRARLVEAASGVDAALGMIEEDNYIPDWDLLRKIRTRARAALAAEGGET